MVVEEKSCCYCQNYRYTLGWKENKNWKEKENTHETQYKMLPSQIGQVLSYKDWQKEGSSFGVASNIFSPISSQSRHCTNLSTGQRSDSKTNASGSTRIFETLEYIYVYIYSRRKIEGRRRKSGREHRQEILGQFTAVQAAAMKDHGVMQYQLLSQDRDNGVTVLPATIRQLASAKSTMKL